MKYSEKFATLNLKTQEGEVQSERESEKGAGVDFEFVLFCGYFYVLFVNLVCGFGYGGISSRGHAIKILCASFFLAVGLPGLIWYQHRRLMKLENLLHDLFEICDKIK